MEDHWQPTLSDEQITLRPLEKRDFKSLFEVASDPLIWDQHPARDRYKREIFQAFFKDALLSEGALIILAKTTGKVLGSSRYQAVKKVPTAVEIGWTFIGRDSWGKGINTKVKDLMITYAFLQVQYVVFYIARKNIRSQRAVEKIGAVRVIHFPLPLIKEGSTDYTYVIHKENWHKDNPGSKFS